MGENFRFFKNYKWIIVATVAVIFLCYYGHAMSLNIGIDTEQYVLGECEKGWAVGSLGRLGSYYSEVVSLNWTRRG